MLRSSKTSMSLFARCSRRLSTLHLQRPLPSRSIYCITQIGFKETSHCRVKETSHCRVLRNASTISVVGQYRLFSNTRQDPPLPTEEDKNTKEYLNRHSGIQLHPDSIGNLIQPGNMVLKETRSGKVQKRYTELVYGYFWMIKDLKRCNDKPVISNEQLIPEKKSKVFPELIGVKSLTGESVDFPEYFVRKNRSHDAAAQCTLVAISFRDFGYQQLASWLDPFRETLGTKDRVEVLSLNVSEGLLNKWILRGFIQGLTKKNTPKELHDSTFLYFASGNNTGQSTDPLEACRDALRMHNVMVGYVFLLDGLGRVRFAGSGEATEAEAKRLITLAKDLTPLIQPSSQNRPTNAKQRPRGRRN